MDDLKCQAIFMSIMLIFLIRLIFDILVYFKVEDMLKHFNFMVLI